MMKARAIEADGGGHFAGEPGLRRRSRRWLAALALPFVLAPAVLAMADEPAGLVVLEGKIRAAECITIEGAPETCDGAAFQEGKPGGVMTPGGFTMLLVDGRILAHLCAEARAAAPPVRVYGNVHAGGAAMTVSRMESDCGGGYVVVDLPFSGVLASGAEGGDE